MEFVLDANILFAALIRDSVTAKIMLHKDIMLFAPEFIIEEMQRYKDQLIEKSNRTKQEFDSILDIFQRKIVLVPMRDLVSELEMACRISPDEKDISYIALALKHELPIWSNDKDLKEEQDAIKVFSTKDLLGILPFKDLR